MPVRLPDARADRERCVELAPALTPEKARMLVKLARVCLELEDSAAAAEHLNQARRIDREIGVFSDIEREEIAKLEARLSYLDFPGRWFDHPERDTNALKNIRWIDHRLAC
jgi:hypothetical protein